MSKTVQWLVKDKEGVISGPFETSQIIQKIRTGVYYGEEFISLYPDGNWTSISYEESFFDELLSVLQNDMSPEDGDPLTPTEPQPPREIPGVEKPKRDWGDPIVADKNIDERTNILTSRNRQKNSIEEMAEKKRKGRVIEDDFGAAAKQSQETAARGDRGRQAAAEDQRRQYEALRQRKQRQRKIRTVIIIILVGVIGFVLFVDKKKKPLLGERYRLLRPKFSKAKKSGSTKGYFPKAVGYFQRDSTENYRRAQELLVARVEDRQDHRAYAFLCMTYRELWGNSYQDSRDFQTVLMVLRRAQKLDPHSQAASICKVVNQWVRGNYRTALRIMEAKLLLDPSFVFFNQMTGDIYSSKKEFSVAAYYFAKAREFWQPAPVWAKTILQEARMMRRLKRYGEAITLYRALLTSYPKHAVGQIEKGILEFEVYQHIEKARGHISTGLSGGQSIPKVIESEAYLNLAKMNLLQGDKKRALKNGKRAFSIDSTNLEARELVISLGGIKVLNSISIDSASLVYVGEQYMKMEKFQEAQNEFRAAYEANPENAFAALRAGQALWVLNQSREAIGWLQKSVLADPTFLRSYVILADYLSARYDFKGAIETLHRARKISKRHHEVWAGYAMVEQRRRNYKAAVTYGERAMKLYDTDVQALLILAKAYKALNDYEKAYLYIQQASELDNSNEDVQATYAKILVDLQGAYAGEIYLESLIKQMPKKIIFRRTRGEILLDEERVDDAIDVFNEILTIQANDKPTLMLMAQALQKQKDTESYDRAREYLIQAASLDPSDAEPLFFLGQLYLESNQSKFAEIQFQRVIQVNQKYPLAHYYAGTAALKSGDLDGALKMAGEEKKINPGLPEPHLLAGEAYFKKSFSKDPTVSSSSASLCADEYRTAITKGYIVAESYIWLARCLRITGALDEAESMLDEAKKLESGNPEIFKEIGAIYEVKGDVEKAEIAYNKYLRLNPQAMDAALIRKRIGILKKEQEAR